MASPTATSIPPPQSAPSFFDDLTTSMITPGYIGQSVLRLVNIAVGLLCILLAYQAIVDPSTTNLYMALGIIPAVGFLASFQWFLYELQKVKSQNPDEPTQAGQTASSDAAKSSSKQSDRPKQE